MTTPSRWRMVLLVIIAASAVLCAAALWRIEGQIRRTCGLLNDFFAPWLDSEL